MTVHNLSAPDVTLQPPSESGWEAMNTFPQDGHLVEVRNAAGMVGKARWMEKETQPAFTEGFIGPATHWREC